MKKVIAYSTDRHLSRHISLSRFLRTLPFSSSFSTSKTPTSNDPPKTPPINKKKSGRKDTAGKSSSESVVKAVNSENLKLFGKLLESSSYRNPGKGEFNSKPIKVEEKGNKIEVFVSAPLFSWMYAFVGFAPLDLDFSIGESSV